MMSTEKRQSELILLVSLTWTCVVSVAVAFNARDYADALQKSILFFDLQRSGPLPSWQRLTWRGTSGLNDFGQPNNIDLRGGYYDAGDNVKFGFPMAFSITLLSWGVVEFGQNLRTAGQLGNTLNAIRWGTDYLLKATNAPNLMWVQVGNPYNDHQCWERPEDMDTSRVAYKVDASNPGSDIAGETAAALAAASVAFRNIDQTYSNTLIARAKMVFLFADKYRGKYSDVIAGEVCPFYCSYSGYKDELIWGAAWLYKATGDNAYYQYLKSNGVTLGGTTTSMNVLSWDNKYAGAQVLLAKFVLSGTPGLQGYKDRANDYICSVLPKTISPSSQTSVTPGGLVFRDGQSNMQYVTTTALLLMTYAKYLSNVGRVVNCAGASVTSARLFAYAKQQADYILGSNPRGMSYMIGFGANNPTHVHHRAASIPSLKVLPQRIGCQQGFTYYNSGGPNPNQATGAILGGPDENDNINDARWNYAQMEPTTYINAAIIPVLAVLASGN